MIQKIFFFILISFSIVSSANDFTKSKIIYLSGKDNNTDVEWRFYCTGGANSANWSKIKVPSCWEFEGFGTYNYGRDKNPADEKGIYKTRMRIRDDWKGNKIYLVFEGVMTDALVKVNGQMAGEPHKGAFYEFSYDITDIVDYDGKNELEVEVSKKSTNESVNKAEREADFWIFGGIHRPVYLKVMPENNIQRVAIDAKADGEFRLKAFLENPKNGTQLKAIIKDSFGNEMGSGFAEVDGENEVLVKTIIEDITAWSPENPALYTVELSLMKKKNLIHTHEERFGFRTVKVVPNDGIYVNGKKIFIKGVNRHTHWPTSGRTTNAELSIQDVKLIKEMNMNAVRMSHYPPEKHFLDACDELGLFVIDELTGWQDAYDTEVGEKLVKELVIRDVNHPSIILWANGNEGGWNVELDDDYEKYDIQKREVIHPWGKHRHTATWHYKTYNCCANEAFNGDEIFFPTEFLHGLYDGGHGAGLRDYSERMWNTPTSIGGFLWVFADEGIIRVDKDSIIDTDKNHAPDGIVGPYREKEGSFFAIKEIWSPIQVKKPTKINEFFSGQIELENRFMYTNLNECKFEFALKRIGLPRKKDFSYGDYEIEKIPSIAPNEKGVLQLDLPNDWQKYDILYLTAVGPDKKEIYTWSWSIKTPQNYYKQLFTKKDTNKIEVSESESALSVKTKKGTFNFDKKTGFITSIQKEGKTIELKDGPTIVGMPTYVDHITHEEKDGKYIINISYNKAVNSMRWMISADGKAQLDYEYDLPSGGYDFMGITFNIPEDKVKNMQWFGNGPYRVWKNRLDGVELNIWEKEYNNTITGESWVYPEFKGYHSKFYWCSIDFGSSVLNIYNSGEEDLFLRMLTPTNPVGAYNSNNAPLFPAGNLSFLHGITAIGTKFTKAEQLGPQSQKNVIASSKSCPMPYKGSITLEIE